MKKSLLLLTSCFALGVANAQIDLPSPSPSATVIQTVGLTEVKIEYNSPGLKGRDVFGSLVPYNELWRTGANMATKVSFSKEVTIGDTKVPAGTYSFFTIPGQTSWTLILNKNYNQSGTSQYKQEEDAVRIQVNSTQVPNRERMSFQVVDFDDNGGSIALEWGTVQVRLPFKTNTSEQALKNIDSGLKSSWRAYASSAQYLLNNNGDMNAALSYINTADQLNNNSWYILWLKAQIQHKLGDKKGALATAKTAHELGLKDGPGYFWRSQVEKALTDWK